MQAFVILLALFTAQFLASPSINEFAHRDWCKYKPDREYCW